jgi:hypothetical protein
MGEKSMREALEESFEVEEEEEKEEEELDAPDDDTGEEEPVVDDDESGESEESEEDTDDQQVPPEADDNGDEEPPEDDPAQEDIPAPVSWTPSVRQLWGKLPQDVKLEVQKREQEISRGLQQASGFKKVAAEYHSVVQPFESLIRAQNSTPAQAITNLMNTAARLTLGNPVQKAEVIKEVIENYAVDIQTLDNVLSGADLPNSEFAPIMQHIDEQLNPMKDFMSQFQTTQESQVAEVNERVQADLDAFANDEKNEFFHDVREDMADIMEIAGRRGREVSLTEAYKQACELHPEVSKILNQRKASKVARISPKNRERKRHASSGVRSSPPAGDGKTNKATTLRGSLESAFEDMDDNAI